MAGFSTLRRCALAALAAFAPAGAAVTTGCQDGYPIAPTPCDEWCDQTRRIDCEPYDPASCVAACEKEGFSKEPCLDLLEQTLECLRENQSAKFDCESQYTTFVPCLGEQAAVLQCGQTQTQSGPPGTE